MDEKRILVGVDEKVFNNKTEGENRYIPYVVSSPLSSLKKGRIGEWLDAIVHVALWVVCWILQIYSTMVTYSNTLISLRYTLETLDVYRTLPSRLSGTMSIAFFETQTSSQSDLVMAGVIPSRHCGLPQDECTTTQTMLLTETSDDCSDMDEIFDRLFGFNPGASSGFEENNLFDYDGGVFTNGATLNALKKFANLKTTMGDFNAGRRRRKLSKARSYDRKTRKLSKAQLDYQFEQPARKLRDDTDESESNRDDTASMFEKEAKWSIEVSGATSLPMCEMGTKQLPTYAMYRLEFPQRFAMSGTFADTLAANVANAANMQTIHDSYPNADDTNAMDERHLAKRPVSVHDMVK